MSTQIVKYTMFVELPSLWPSGIGSRLGRNRLRVRFLAVSNIYPMFIEPTITWVPSGFSGWTQKLCWKKKLNSHLLICMSWLCVVINLTYWYLVTVFWCSLTLRGADEKSWEPGLNTVWANEEDTTIICCPFRCCCCGWGCNKMLGLFYNKYYLSRISYTLLILIGSNPTEPQIYAITTACLPHYD